MTSVIPRALSDRAFELVTADEVVAWIGDVAGAVGGVTWRPLGGIDNNVHTVEVASDPGLALVEIPVNGIDALLELEALKHGEGATTPHAAANRWYDVPAGGLAAMATKDQRDTRAELAQRLVVTMLESGDPRRPTITIQDAGTGQHPDDWSATLLSLLASNKKTKGHQMGVYNAGGAASCRFARAKVIASRLAPSIAGTRDDAIGISVVHYDPLDPDRYKSGSYLYLAAADGSILLLDRDELPNLPWGTYVKLIEYELSRYSRAAHEPKSSLWHLLHAALPAPPLPLQIVETRNDRFPGVRGIERRTVAGLLSLLSRKGVADYNDIRTIDMGSDLGRLTLRYFVLNEGADPDAYTTSDQALTITLNGQRQLTRNRAWLKRQLELPFLFRRLVVVVDGTTLTNAAKRAIFASTRESGADTAETRLVLERMVEELKQDEGLYALDEQQRQRALEDATRSTTEKVKRQLASQIGSYLRGELRGNRGGGPGPRRPPRPPRPPAPPEVDDSHLLEVPDRLALLTDPVQIEPGGTAALRLELNAKNDFLPRHGEGLTVVIGPELAGQMQTRSLGRLVGGRARVTLEASEEAPETESSLRVVLAVPDLGVLLMSEGRVVVARRKPREERDSPRGGEPNIDVSWVGRESWERLGWDDQRVGVCELHHEDADHPDVITRVAWIMNEDFEPYARVVRAKRLTETTLKSFREGYEYPVLFGLFRQRLAELEKERGADDEGRAIEIPDDYVHGEQARMARAVLMAMEPELTVSGLADAA
jgi:hypothetical protein